MNIEDMRVRGERIAILAAFAETLSPEQSDAFFRAMREANFMVDRDADKKSPEEAARWLADRIGL